jgi:molybdenum cofactor cytidylyltransferase
MITAIVLAAGDSKRMGQPKMLMPWGKSTVLQTVISTIRSAGITDILVVTGGARRQVEALVGTTAQTIYNENYPEGEMLSSIQTALIAKMDDEADAALICLGDQPQVTEGSVRQVCDTFRVSNSPIVVPSYQMHRGHPWLLARPLWAELIALKWPLTSRDFLNGNATQIKYVEMDTPSIIEDLDTPQDYEKFRS